MTTPRFSTGIASVRYLPSATVLTSSGSTTREVVEGEAPGGTYRIRGIATRTRTPLQLDTGDIVTVLWQRGAPFMILDLASRKGPGTDEPFGNPPIIEELFITNDETVTPNRREVWFRNAKIVANLKLRAGLPDNPDEVKWGSRGDSFFVRVGSKYFTYTFPRPGGTRGLDIALTRAPKPKLKKQEFPWTNSTLIAKVTYNATVTVDTPCVWSFSTEDNTFTADVASTLTRSSSKSQVYELRFTEAANIEVVDASLDYKHNLILTISAGVPDFVQPPPSDIVAKVQARDLVSFDPQCILNGPGSPWFAATMNVDSLTAVVNVTEARVVWSTALAETVLNRVQRQQDSGTGGLFAAGVVGMSVQLNQGENTNFAPTSGIAPTETTITGPDGPIPVNIAFADVSLPRDGLGALHIFNTPALAFLNLPFPIDSGDVSVPSTWYGGQPGTPVPFGSRGSLNELGFPNPGFANVFLRYSITDTTTRRGNILRIRPIRYLPHRTRVGGDIYLFVNCIEIVGNSTGEEQFSIWKYTTDTNKAVAIFNWVPIDSTSTGISTGVIDGASLRHLLWFMRLSFGSEPDPFTKQFVVRLSGVVEVGTALSGASKILVDATVPEEDPTPTSVLNFLKHQWRLPRPDLLYVLDGTDEKIKNKFITGWTKAAITLDPLIPKEDTRLRGKGFLKKLPTNVVPLTGSEDGFPVERGLAPSIRALQSRAALGSRFLDDK